MTPAEAKRRESWTVALRMCDVLSAATRGVSGATALEPVAAAVARVPDAQLRRVLVAAVVELTWNAPPAVVRPRTGDEIWRRQGELLRWVRGIRATAKRALA